MADKPVRQPVVWLINEGGHDFSPAEKYGRLMPITTGSVNTFNPDRLMVLIQPRLRVADASDYLVMSGSPVLNALVFAMWLERFEKANLLLYSGKKVEYKPVTITKNAVSRMANGDGTPAP